MKIVLNVQEVVVVTDGKCDKIYFKSKDAPALTATVELNKGPAYVESLGVDEYMIIDTVNKKEY